MIKYQWKTDNELKARLEELKELFKKTKQRFFQGKDYYINIKYHDKSLGLRWYFRGKYQVEIVVDSKGEGAHKNICDFILFSTMQDAILYAVLKEDSHLFNSTKDVQQ